VGVAAHEAGHAVQHAENYFPIVVRSAIVPVTNIGSRLSMPLILIGLILEFSLGFSFGYPLALLGVFCFSLCVLFQLITLPTEFNASHRAVTAITETRILGTDDEINGTKKVLFAAAMTYVTSFLVSLAQLLRLLALSNRRRR
jgi:Zn-dependent membrane protease YugP